MTRDLLRETVLAIGAAAFVIVMAVGLAVILTGCASIEGSGFQNSGAHHRPACVTRDARGNEDWRSC